jgi:hypothetical protein
MQAVCIKSAVRDVAKLSDNSFVDLVVHMLKIYETEKEKEWYRVTDEVALSDMQSFPGADGRARLSEKEFKTHFRVIS